MLPVSHPFCAACEAALTIPDVVCPGCAEPLPPGGRCACRRRAPAFSAARCAVVYDGPAIAALLRFKHGKRRDLARPLGRHLSAALLAPPFPPLRAAGRFIVAPVPLHPRRLRARGYNQALELARFVRAGLAVIHPAPALWVDLLARTRDTPSLGHLGVAERRAAVVGAFVCRARASLAGATVLLVDDVMTTGATLDECARALIAAGAAQVVAAAFARAAGT